MIETLPLAIGIGLVVSLLLSELLGVASAGMVVPGYLALYAQSPLHLASTLLACFATYGVVRAAGSFLILYGRRRTALAILVGYLCGALFRYLIARHVPGIDPGADVVIGYIIPGLVAIWMDRQGVWETLGALSICTVVVRLVLIVALGTDLPDVGVLG